MFAKLKYTTSSFGEDLGVYCKRLQNQIPPLKTGAIISDSVFVLKSDEKVFKSLCSASPHEKCCDLRTNIFFRLARLVVDLSLHNCCSTPVDVFVELAPRFVQFSFPASVVLIHFAISITKNLIFFLST